MIFFYLIISMLASIMMLQRSMFYIQMNNYKIRLKGGMIHELLLIILFTFILYSISIFVIQFGYIGNIFYALDSMFIVVFALLMLKRTYKVKPNWTKRVKRLFLCFIVNILLITLILLLIITYFRSNTVKILLINGVFLINWCALLLSNSIMKPYENEINQHYIQKAKEKMATFKKLKVIGITGSYGKTSVKNILSTILSSKYNVVSTPKSYNTPLGIAMTIDELSINTDYFIVEMGARHEKDIEYLCNIVKPDFGIITGVTSQHLETFHDIKTIERTKYELYECIQESGFCVFNGYDDICYKMYNYSKSSNSIISNFDRYYVDNISTNINGSSFDLVLDGNKVKCNTRLIGKHNIQNILLASIMAYKLGVNIDDIASKITEVKQCEHRCELLSNNNITIIDDSYNANLNGIKCSLDAISQMQGRKIVASQGIVEGGKKQVDMNILVGRYIAKTADIVVLIGRNRKYIYKGLIDSGYNVQNIFMAKTLIDAENIFAKLLKSGDILLLSNDLPDNY